MLSRYNFLVIVLFNYFYGYLKYSYLCIIYNKLESKLRELNLFCVCRFGMRKLYYYLVLLVFKIFGFNSMIL